MLIQLLGLIVVKDLYCDATNSSICYFTECTISDEIRIEYDGISNNQLEISLFISDSCNPNNVNISGNLNIQSRAPLSVSGGFSMVRKDLSNFVISLQIEISGLGLLRGSFFALSVDKEVLLSDISISGVFNQADADRNFIFGGLVVNIDNNILVSHVEFSGVEVSLDRAENVGFLVGVVNNTFAVILYEIVVDSLSALFQGYPHFALDIIELPEGDFFCDSKNLEFELRMRRYALDNYNEHRQESWIKVNDVNSFGFIGCVQHSSIEAMQISLIAALEMGKRGYNAGEFAGIIIDCKSIAVDKAYFESSSLTVFSNAGVIGTLINVEHGDFKLAASFVAMPADYSGIFGETQGGAIRISAAVDLHLAGSMSGGIIGLQMGTDMTVNEFIGHVELANESLYNGLIVGLWQMNGEAGRINNITCGTLNGCTLNTLDEALLNGDCNDYRKR